MALLHRNPEALECFDQSLRLNPQYSKAYLLKASLLAEIGRTPDALNCIDQAIKIKPTDKTAFAKKAEILWASGSDNQALQCCEQAIALEPNDDGLWVTKASILAKSQRYDDGLSALDQALNLNGSNAEAWRKKGAILATAFNHYSEAMACIEEARRLGDAQAADLIVKLRQALEAQRTRGLSPPAGVGPEAVALFNKGNSLFGTGRHREAASLFERAVTINPRFEQAWCNRGRCLRMSGDDAGALALSWDVTTTRSTATTMRFPSIPVMIRHGSTKRTC